jgi:hypothetical protein
VTSGLVPSLARRFADDLVPDAGPAADGAVRSPSGDSVLVAALAAALCVLVGALGARDAPCADATTLLQPSPPPRPDELRGFVRVAGGWLGVAAVHDEQRGHVERVVADAGRRGGTVAAVACRLQSLGVAALPASAIGRAAATGHPVWRQRYRVGPVLRGATPLAGVRVLDLGRLVAGPLAGALLAELGAEVVTLRPPGQAGATADVHTTAGRDLLADRFRWADLVVDNFSWRGWDQLRTTVGARPRRHVGVRGFPATSPCRDWKVYGYLAEAATGLVRGRLGRIAGFVAAPEVPVVDRVAGILAAAVAVRALAAPSADAHVSLIGVARAIAAEAGAQREAR